MSILTIGGDLRYAHLTRLAAAHPMEIAAVGLERAPFPLPAASLDDLAGARAIVLQNPWRGGLSLPYAEKAFTLTDVLSRLRSDALLLLSDTAGMPDLPEGLRIADLSKDAEYVLKNAHLTAEGAIFSAMNRSALALQGAMCLVIGYGRIGKRLSHLLHALGAQAAVAARRASVRDQIRADGLSAFSMEELPSLLPGAQFIFSTPPETVLDESLLRQVSPDALLMDLASPPYGFDLALAGRLSIHAVRENGLPGRYCPLSAGKVLLDAVLRALNAS